MKKLLIISFVLLFTVLVFAQDKIQEIETLDKVISLVEAPAKEIVVESKKPSETSTRDWVVASKTQVGGTTGASVAGILVLICQAVLAYLRTPQGKELNLSGNAQFLIAGFFGLVLIPASFMVQGMDISASLASGVFITAGVDYLFQIIDRFILKKLPKKSDEVSNQDTKQGVS